tara:strand:+ start:401 stop:703 length:303 start_codon:yes stop_codon:yes gene_type:complete
MINFKNVIKTSDPSILEFIVTIEGNPVWDYKMAGYDTISLIANIQDGLEEEYVTLKEVRKYVVECEIPFGIVKFREEESRELLTNFQWDSENKIINFSKS